MMRRGIEDKFNPSREFVKGLGMQPVLINEADAQHGDDHGWVVAKQRQRHPEGVLEDALTDALAQRCSEVVVLGAVMRYVPCPKEPNFMITSVKAVVSQVVKEEQQDPPVPTRIDDAFQRGDRVGDEHE